MAQFLPSMGEGYVFTSICLLTGKWDTPQYGSTVNAHAVRILLECILLIFLLLKPIPPYCFCDGNACKRFLRLKCNLSLQGLFARVGSGDPVRVLRLFHNNYTGYCCIHLLCRATYNLSLPRLSANYYGLPTTVQLRAAHESRCSLVGVSRSTGVRYCTVPALNGIITGPFSPPFAGRSFGGI